jgi:cystathionine gamma-synthase
MHVETLAVHAGRHIDPTTGAVTAPIHLSTTFERGADGGFPSGFIYSRESNPNRAMLETCLAALEGGTDAVAFASGMAAITAVIECLPIDRPRRLLIPADVYFGVRPLLAATDLADRFDVRTVDLTDLDATYDACRTFRPGLMWIETPSNPLLHVTDIAAVSALAHAVGAFVAVDNTWATPVLQHPLALGADLAVHALTKYIGGHSDVMLGAVIARERSGYVDNIRSAQVYKGAVPSPFECWLALRSIQSLAPRLAAHCRNAQAVAAFLAAHSAVTVVHYPGLPSHPAHALAMRQMNGIGGGMLSFEIDGGRAEAMAVANALRLFIRATSLGGAHSLIEHRASIEGPGTRAPESLLRLSIGTEHADDLIADLDWALSAVFGQSA